MEPLPIHREGNYHDELPDPENPSATALRQLLTSGGDWQSYIPEKAREFLTDAPLHNLQSGERAILGKLRTMTDAEFESLPYGSEGLWRKFMKAAREEATLEDIVTATKSKRYTRTRLDRMVMCAFLGLTQEALLSPPPYVRVLAFTDRGRTLLKDARKGGTFLNAGELSPTPYGERERIIGDLYGLFSVDGPEKPGVEHRRRVCYLPK